MIDMEYKSRKYPRLKQFNYSLPGYYYVTIHNEIGAPLLAHIKQTDIRKRAEVKLTKIGFVAAEQLYELEQRYGYVRIDKYVIMPTHIHAILCLQDGSMPRPGLTDIMGAYKSLTTRKINEVLETPGKKQFQRSFYETVIRNVRGYQSCWKYIDENPDKWMVHDEAEWDWRTADEIEPRRR